MRVTWRLARAAPFRAAVKLFAQADFRKSAACRFKEDLGSLTECPVWTFSGSFFGVRQARLLPAGLMRIKAPCASGEEYLF